MSLNAISIDQMLKHDVGSKATSYRNHIILGNNMGTMNLFTHPVRVNATTILVCTNGEMDCSINLKNYSLQKNSILVQFAGDIIQVHRATDVSGFAILFSTDYLNTLQIDFKQSYDNYIYLRNNTIVHIPEQEISQLKPYYSLLQKNMEEERPEVLKGLVQAFIHTIISLMRQYQPASTTEKTSNPREQQIFNRFIQLLNTHHLKERSIKFYADKMCLTANYVSSVIKEHSGKSALEWINKYIVLEAKIMLRYTEYNIKEIAYRLNFPTQSAFGKYFKQQTGISPKQYRLDTNR